MNKIKFSSLVKLLSVTLLMSACLLWTSCTPEPEEPPIIEEGTDSTGSNAAAEAKAALIGDWISVYEKYAITENSYNNYYSSNNGFVLYYSTTDIVVSPLNSTSGYLYGKFDDENHVGYRASVGQWYALYYNNLTASTVSFYQPFKDGGKGGCDSLEEAKAEYTLANEYYDLEHPSECTK